MTPTATLSYLTVDRQYRFAEWVVVYRGLGPDGMHHFTIPLGRLQIADEYFGPLLERGRFIPIGAPPGSRSL